MTPEIPADPASGPSLRDRLLMGEALHFQKDDQESDRTLEADWIVLAAAKKVRIDVRNAIIVGALQLRYAVFEDELTIEACRLGDFADFSYATFKRNLVASDTTFENGVTFHGATLDHDALLARAHVSAGSALFHDIHVKGLWLANYLCTGDDVETNFNRARFDRTAFFLNSNFGGKTSFRGVRFGDQAAFQGAVFKSSVNFNAAIIGHHALFRSEPESNAGGVTFEGSVDFFGAQISGQALFQDAVFKKDAAFDEVRFAQGLLCHGVPNKDQKAATFEGKATFVGAEILRTADFSGGVVFRHRLDFTRAVIDGSAYFNGSDKDGLPAATCEGEVVFTSARIAGSLDCRGVLFKETATLIRTSVAGSAIFSGESQHAGRAAVFEKKADFTSALIRGQADFRGTVFRQEVSFDQARLEGGAFFRNEPSLALDGAFFGGAASFVLSHFGGTVDFKGALFKQDVTFSGARIEGTATFGALPNPSAIFEGEANFSSTQVYRLEMEGAKFKKNATFSGASIADSAIFRGAVFEGDADFSAAHLRRDASFVDAVFGKQMRFSLTIFDAEAFFSGATLKKDGEGDFGGAHFGSVADFERTIFEAPVDFYAVQCDGLAIFVNSVFQETVSFAYASFTGLHFSEHTNDAPDQQFLGSVGLIGCSYAQIQGDWRSLMTRTEPYDRQPYVQLERVLRVAGRDREADGVYLARHHRERRLRLRQREVGGWLFSLAYRCIANYGVRPYRLIVAAAVLLSVGTCFFSVRGTVSAKAPVTGPARSEPVKLSTLEAFGVSLRQFLPVDVPLGSQWIPSEMPVGVTLPLIARKLPSPLDVPTFFATFFLRLAGWILVPLGIAALTGLLRVKV